MDNAIKMERRIDSVPKRESYFQQVGPLTSGVALGGVGGLAFLVLISLLGMGVGLFFMNFNDGLNLLSVKGVLLGLAAALGISIGYFVGGAAANAIAEPRNRRTAYFLGFLVWAFTTSVLVIGFGGKLSSGVMGFIAGANASTSTNAGLKGVFTEIEKVSPRIVSDVEIIKGKIVSYLDFKEPRAVKETPRDPALDKAADEARKNLAVLSLGTFFALLAAAFASMWGATKGFSRWKPVAS